MNHKNQDQTPTTEELSTFALASFKGIDVGLNQADPMVDVSNQLERKYPGHLILIQSGKFLHAYNRSAYALSMLKTYKLTLAGTTDSPHLRAGFPAGNFQKRLWPLVNEFQIPYVVYLGNRTDGYTVYVSSQEGCNATVLSAVSDQIVNDVIADLVGRGQLNQASTKQMLANPDSSGFKLKTQAQDLDTLLLQDIIKMPRELRATFGENLRTCMGRIMREIFVFGTSDSKAHVLARLSADIDLLKYYLTQAPRLSKLKFAFDHRAGSAVELGRLVGGLIRAGKVNS